MVAEVWSPLLLLPLRDGAGEDLFSGDFRRLVFCFLHVVSGVHDGGGRSLAEVDGRLEHEGVLCGRFSTDVIFCYALLCIGVQINRGFFAPDASLPSETSSTLLSPAWLLEDGGMFCPSVAVLMTTMPSVTTLRG